MATQISLLNFHRQTFYVFQIFPHLGQDISADACIFFQHVKMTLCEIVFSLGMTMILMFLGKQIPLRWVSQQLQ